MSASALALSQENLRFLSCHGQIKRKSNPPVEPNFPRAVRQTLSLAGGAIRMGVDG
jgi:hypothetical protein